MPNQVGLLSNFDNLDQIPAEAIACWIKPPPSLTLVENHLANRILYPNALPLTEYEMKIDLGILREVLKLNGPGRNAQKTQGLLGDNPFLNTTLRKILIPAKFLDFVPDLLSLTWIFVDAFLLDRKKKDYFSDLWTIVLTSDSDEIAGTVMLPQFKSSGGAIKLSVLGKSYEIKQGEAAAIPCFHTRCEISYVVQKGVALGKTESAIEVYGGKLGLVIDGRGL